MTNDPERDRLSGRLTRFAKVGAGLSGAARRADQACSREDQAARAARKDRGIRASSKIGRSPLHLRGNLRGNHKKKGSPY